MIDYFDERNSVLVLHVIASGSRRGAEVFASDLIRSLTRSGVHQSVALLHGPDPHELDLGIDATVLSPHTSDHDAAKLDRDLRRALGKHIRAVQPDVVQAHGGEALKYLALTRSPPVVYRRIGSSVGRVLLKGPRRVAFALQLRAATRVIAVAESVREETIDVFRLRPSKVVTIPNAVDPARLQPQHDRATVRRSLGIADDAVVVLFLGAFTWEKDPVAAVRVAARVMSDHERLVLVMAGDGPLRPQVEEARRSLPHPENVLLLGSRRDVGDILAASDVLLSSSQTEGMPANVIEAGLLGLPVVSYALTGIPEIVENGVTGSLADPDEDEDLENHLRRLIHEPELRAAMGAAAKRRCEAEFAIDPVAARYLDVYEDVLRIGGGR
jgi:glycosyltransferase involved in cell wall biosynthesis